MKTIPTIVLMLTCSLALVGADATDKAVQDAEKAWAKAVAARDFAALDGMLGDNLIYAHSSGTVESKRQYVDNMKSGAQKYDSIVHESTKVAPYGNTAVAHSNVRMKGTNAQGPFDHHLMMMHVWAQQDGKWKLVAHQTTRLTN